MLPKFEVVIPEEQEGAATPAAAPGAAAVAGPVDKPGAYILQAGSFRNHADADRVRALIAMQGVESKIQKVTIDRDTWHRVRVGPITNLKQLEETRSKLRNARIDALVIKIGE
jgi:cell division protein FtsN